MSKEISEFIFKLKATRRDIELIEKLIGAEKLNLAIDPFGHSDGETVEIPMEFVRKFLLQKQATFLSENVILECKLSRILEIINE